MWCSGAQHHAGHWLCCGTALLRGCCGAPRLCGVTVPTTQGTSAQCQPVMPFIRPQPNQPQGFSFYRLREPGCCLGRGYQPDVAPPAPQAKPYQLPYWGEVALNTFFWHVASPESSSTSSGVMPFIALVLRQHAASLLSFIWGGHWAEGTSSRVRTAAASDHDCFLVPKR